MLKLNNPIYEITSAYGHFGRKPQIKVNLLGKKQIKLIYLNCNLEKTIIFFKKK
jgi:S-adenosylmethionine synthetase